MAKQQTKAQIVNLQLTTAKLHGRELKWEDFKEHVKTAFEQRGHTFDEAADMLLFTRQQAKLKA